MEDNAISASNGTSGVNGISCDLIGSIEDVICRDYLRNVCTRGSRCKFKHPSSDDSRQLVNLQRSGLTFCHDFQNTSCSRQSCRFIHGTRQDEEHYRATGELPKAVLNGSVNRGIFQDGNSTPNSTEGDIPLCKDFLKGDCHRGKKCKFRHLDQFKTENRDQRQERNEEFEGPEAKRRHFMEENDFISRSHVSLSRLQSYDFGAYFRDRQLSPPPSQRCFGTSMVNSTSSPTIHLQPTITMGGVCNHLELRLLQEENLLMRRKVEDLKKQVSDLMATNEFLLEQNAHLRIQGKIPTVCSSVATVNIPTVTIANSMTVPVTTSVQAIGLAPIPTVQSVQATATLPLVTHTAQSTSTLNASIPYAGSVSLTQQTPMATVSIAPVTLNQTGALAAPQAPSLSGAAATVTLTPTATLAATALQLGPNTALSLSGANGGSLVSYPIMTQSIIAPQSLQSSLTH